MDGFEEIYKLYYADVYNFINKLTHYNHHIAEELTQETFYHVYLSFHKFKGQSHIRTWILGIAKNRYFGYLRANKHIDFSVEEILGFTEDKQQSIENAQIKKELLEYGLKVIFEMKSPMKEVVLSRIFTNKSYNAIAVHQKISVSSAKVFYFRGKKMLREKLKEKYGYEI